MTTNTEALRQQFEDWAIEQPRVAAEDDCFSLDKRSDRYASGLVQSLWLAWKAALASAPAQPVAQIEQRPSGDKVLAFCNGHGIDTLPVGTSLYSGAPAQPVAMTDRPEPTVGWRAHAEALEVDMIHYRARLDAVNRHQQEDPDVWYWQNDGQDNLESMVHSLPVVIRADHLRALIAATPTPAESKEEHAYRMGFLEGQIDMRDRPEEQPQVAQPVGYVSPSALTWITHPDRRLGAYVTIKLTRRQFLGSVPLYTATRHTIVLAAAAMPDGGQG